MQDIQTFGAGISSFPPPLKEVIHTENKEDFFSMPPSPLQEKNIPKKSFFFTPNLTFFICDRNY
jgi:hypothetical protein